MALAWIQKVIDQLEQGGISAYRGYPATKQAYLKEPMAAVCLGSATEDKAVLTVHICTSVEMGGAICEDVALQAAGLLTELGGLWKMGTSAFKTGSGLFVLPIEVTFSREPQGAEITVTVDGVAVEGLVSVRTEMSGTSVKDTDDSENVIMVTADKRWVVTVTESVDGNTPLRWDGKDGFCLTVVRNGEKEVYSGCSWQKMTTNTTDTGTERVRVAITCNEPVITEIS